MLVFGLLGGADPARAYAYQQAVQNASRSGAELFVLNTTKSDSEIRDRVRLELAGAPGLDLTQVTDAKIPITKDACAGGPTVASPCYVTVGVQYTFSTIIAWPLVPRTP